MESIKNLVGKYAAQFQPKPTKQVDPQIIQQLNSSFNTYANTPQSVNPVMFKARQIQTLKTKYLDITPIAQRFQGFMKGTLNPVIEKVKMGIQNDFDQYIKLQSASPFLMAGPTTDQRNVAENKLKSFRPGGLPVGSILNTAMQLFSESPEVTAARTKVLSGQKLTTAERQTVDSEGIMAIGGMSESLKLGGKGAAIQELRGLMNYSAELLKKGYGAEEVQNISYTKAKQLLKEIPTSKIKKQLFDQVFSEWMGKRNVAKSKALEVAKNLVNIPYEMGMQVIDAIESNKTAPMQLEKFVTSVKDIFDSLYLEAKQAGVDVGYIKNYVTHIWKQSPEEVEQAFRSASKKFKYSAERKIPTYKEGVDKLKLDPLYTHPSEIAAHYAKRLEEVKANIDLFRKLQEHGLISDTPKLGYQPIIAPGFPTASIKDDMGKNIKVPFYAPQDIALLINRIFSPAEMTTTERFFNFLANASSRLQEFSLSGGAPKTPLNAFSLMAGLQREYLSGNFVSPTLDFLRSFSGTASRKFFEENIDVIKRMQLKNIPLNTDYTISNLIPKGFLKDTFGEKVGEVWSKVMNEPTFSRFFPMLEINTFKNVEQAALRHGLGAEEAANIATKAVKNFYGVVGTDELAKRSQLGQDLVTTFAFAPKYRESIINFWVNNLKALGNPLALENQQNIRFLMGTLAAYFAYDILNVAFNGKHLHENPPGKELMLMIPHGDTTIGVPFLSSLGTLPRGAYQALSGLTQGKIEPTQQLIKTTTSQLMRGPMDIVSNEDYWGGEIYDAGDDQKSRLQKVSQYLIQQYDHPYMRLLAGGDDPAYQKLSKALELPFRFYDTEKVNSAWYYQFKDDAIKTLTPEQRTILDRLHQGKRVDEDGLPIWNQQGEMAAALDRLSNAEIVRAEKMMAMKTSAKTKEPINPFYLLEPSQIYTVLLLKTFYPGDTTKSSIIEQNKDWLNDYWDARNAWITQMKELGKFKGESLANAPPELQKKLDYYYTLPKGTGSRSAFLRYNSDVLQYFNQKRAETNQQRVALGLPPVQTYANNYGYRKPRTTLKAPKLKAPKLKTKKMKIKQIKPLKFTIPKISKTTVFEQALSQIRRKNYG